jgi:hypothetical protein
MGREDSGDVLEDAERFQRLFVTPMVDAVRTEMRSHLAPLMQAQADTDKRLASAEGAINELKGKQTKALLGWGVYASAAALAIGSAWGWVKAHLHIG